MRTSEISARASVRETQDRTATRNSNTTPDHHSDSVQDEHRQQIKCSSFIFPSACTYSPLHFDNVLQREIERYVVLPSRLPAPSRLALLSRPTVRVSWPRGGHSPIGSRIQQVHY